MPTTAQSFAALSKLTPAEAVAYLQGRDTIKQTYGWQDLWQQEHAQAFTVSRLTRADLLQSIQEQISASVNGDLSRRDFMRDSKAMLTKAGLWGTTEVTDPVTGEILETTFNPARLKLIFDTNTSMAYAAGQWDRIQQTKTSHPYLRYITLHDDRVRIAHQAWDNVTLPVDDPFWTTHFPPNGWRCRCRVVSVNKREYAAGKTPGGGTMRKEAPDLVTREWRNPRTDQILPIPVGIDPGFGYNPGMAGKRVKSQNDVAQEKLSRLSPPIESAVRAAGVSVPAIARALLNQPTWKTLGLADLRTVTALADAPPLLPAAASAKEALETMRTALGVEAGGSIRVETPVEMVTLHDFTLPHVVEKRLDRRERFADFLLPTLRNPTEVWATEYDDATKRNRYIKLFNGPGYDLLVIVKVEPDGGIVWNLMQRDRKKMNDQRVGVRLFGGT